MLHQLLLQLRLLLLQLLPQLHDFFSELLAKRRSLPALQGSLAHPLDRRLHVEVLFGADRDGTIIGGATRRRRRWALDLVESSLLDACKRGSMLLPLGSKSR